MELKEYQQNTLKRVKAYLEALKNWRVKNEKVVAAIGKDAAPPAIRATLGNYPKLGKEAASRRATMRSSTPRG